MVPRSITFEHPGTVAPELKKCCRIQMQHLRNPDAMVFGFDATLFGSSNTSNLHINFWILLCFVQSSTFWISWFLNLQLWQNVDTYNLAVLSDPLCCFIWVFVVSILCRNSKREIITCKKVVWVKSSTCKIFLSLK